MHQARRRSSEGIEAWHTLVHVCRHWRNIVFGSPLRLNLQLLCKASTPVKERLDVWPALPIRVRDQGPISELDNIIAVLEYNDRICEVFLREVPNSLLERVYAALMQEPFPVLTQLELQARYDATTPAAVHPGPFPGVSAPRLRGLSLEGIPIPALPKFLLSATHLISLVLYNIPHPGYVSPEAVVTCLSALTGLEHLCLDFQLPQFYTHLEIPPRPLSRSTLRSLKTFGFGGVSQYLEDFVARIDTPRLNNLTITFFNHIIPDTSQLVHFIDHTPFLKAPDEIRLTFYGPSVFVTLSSPAPGSEESYVKILCAESSWHASSLAQVCRSFSPFLSAVESLYIYQDRKLVHIWQDEEVESTEWSERFRPFTVVKNLYLCELSAPHIAPALRVLAKKSMTEVLPVLQNVSLEGIQPSGPVQDCIGQFVAARQFSGHPITVCGWERA
jgi:hypothetical protein